MASDRRLPIDRLPEALLVVDDHRRYVDANEAACTLMGLPRDEILSCRVDDILAASPDKIDSLWEDLLRRGELAGRATLRHPRDGVIDVEYRSRAYAAPGLHVSVLRKAEPVARTERPLVLEFLGMQEALLAPDMSVEAVMRVACERATALTGGEGSTIEIQEGATLVYRVATGTMAPFQGFRLQAASSLSGLSIETGTALTSEDTELDERVDRAACRRVGVRSMVVVPLFHDAKVVGVLKVAWGQARAIEPGIADLLRVIAGFVGSSMVKAQAQEARAALLRAERQRMLELERLRSELASLVVHDLRSPLSAVAANLEYLREQLPAVGGDAIEAAVDAIEATRRIDDLIRMFLEMTRLEDGALPLSLAKVSPAEIADAVVTGRRRAAGQGGVRISNRIAPSIVLKADAALMRRALENIVDNALRYTPANGQIELWCDATPEAIEVRVGNSGPQIPDDEREKIFEKFVQARRSGRANFGLGLYFCRLVAEAHGGRIWVESTPTLATVFGMSFPPRP
jgi:signal transduction histidine kinase